jgi:hypothetical protein
MPRHPHTILTKITKIAPTQTSHKITSNTPTQQPDDTTNCAPAHHTTQNDTLHRNTETQKHRNTRTKKHRNRTNPHLTASLAVIHPQQRFTPSLAQSQSQSQRPPPCVARPAASGSGFSVGFCRSGRG